MLLEKIVLHISYLEIVNYSTSYEIIHINIFFVYYLYFYILRHMKLYIFIDFFIHYLHLYITIIARSI